MVVSIEPLLPSRTAVRSARSEDTVAACPLTLTVEPISTLPLTTTPASRSAILMTPSPPTVLTVVFRGATVSTLIFVVAELEPLALVATTVNVSEPCPNELTVAALKLIDQVVPTTVADWPLTVTVVPAAVVPDTTTPP